MTLLAPYKDKERSVVNLQGTQKVYNVKLEGKIAISSILLFQLLSLFLILVIRLLKGVRREQGLKDM